MSLSYRRRVYRLQAVGQNFGEKFKLSVEESVQAVSRSRTSIVLFVPTALRDPGDTQLGASVFRVSQENGGITVSSKEDQDHRERYVCAQECTQRTKSINSLLLFRCLLLFLRRARSGVVVVCGQLGKALLRIVELM